MPDYALHITHARLTPASNEAVGAGLLGYVSLVLNGQLFLDGLTLRCSRSGIRYIAFPGKLRPDGLRHHHIRPVGEQARREFECEVFRALDLGEVSR